MVTKYFCPLTFDFATLALMMGNKRTTQLALGVVVVALAFAELNASAASAVTAGSAGALTGVPTFAAAPASMLAATGFNSAPWLIGAGVLVLFGIALFALTLFGRRRERVEAEELADAASETPENTGADGSISRDGS